MKKEIPLVILSTLIVILLVILSFVSFHFSSQNSKPDQNILLTAQNSFTYTRSAMKIGGKGIVVDIADDAAKRALGLSGRIALASDAGMLFVFENSGKYGFWMKDMNFPIDIIWIDEAGKIVHIEKSLSPDTYPKVFGQQDTAKYVLEVQSGFSDAQHVKIGDKVTLPTKI